MSLNGGIQRFLNDVESKIFRRGLDYYRSGMVERIGWSRDCVMAEVSGSEEEPYLVEIKLSEDGEVEDWSCDCPYNWGPVCKHVVAALLAFKNGEAEKKELPESTAADAAKRKAAIEKLLGQAEPEQLAALVLEHCQKDKRFQCQVLSDLEDGGELELDAIKELVQETIRSNTRRGLIDRNGCDNICAELDDILDRASRRIQREQWGIALEITRFVLLTGMKLAGEADSSSGALSWTISAAMETVTLEVNALVESGQDRTEWVTRLLETVRRPELDGWDHWRYDLLCQTTALANEENEGEFYETLADLSDRRWGAFQDGPRYDDQDKLIRYYVIRYVHGSEAARGYLKRNPSIEAFLTQEDT